MGKNRISASDIDNAKFQRMRKTAKTNLFAQIKGCTYSKQMDFSPKKAFVKIVYKILTCVGAPKARVEVGLKAPVDSFVRCVFKLCCTLLGRLANDRKSTRLHST